MSRASTPLDHDQFVDVLTRHAVPAGEAHAMWREPTAAPPGPGTGPSRVAFASLLAGMVMLGAAGIWWATLIFDAFGGWGLVAFGFVWLAVAGVAAEVARRRDGSCSSRPGRSRSGSA